MYFSDCVVGMDDVIALNEILMSITYVICDSWFVLDEYY